MARTALLLLLVVTLTGCTRWRLVVDAVPAEDELTETEVMRDPTAGGGSPKVALIDLNGLIVDAERSRILGRIENPVARLVEALKKAEGDTKVKAVLLRVNSPGGTVTGSDMIYNEINSFRDRSGKPVVVLMGEVAASGGYYVACAGDEIIAYPTTITGSIGVIIQTFNFSEGMRKIGIRADAITSGENKAMGSPFEPMPAEQRELFQNVVDEFYANFLGVVTTNRTALSEADLGWITDGRIITGARAAEVGVVDRTGDLADAFESCKSRAGVMTARLVKYHRPLEFVGSAYADTPAPGTEINLMQLNVPGWPDTTAGFYYLWDPSIW